MGTTTDPREIVEALAAHEETLSAVYTAYADAFPDVKKLWRTMAAEEFMHGKLLRGMLDRDEDLKAYVEARQLDLDAITAETKKLRNFAQLAGVAGLGLLDALHSAVRWEGSIIESEAFTAKEGDTPEMVAVLETLKEQTERHKGRLSESIETYRT